MQWMGKSSYRAAAVKAVAVGDEIKNKKRAQKSLSERVYLVNLQQLRLVRHGSSGATERFSNKHDNRDKNPCHKTHK